MASIVFGGGITNAVGSHAGNTFARNKGGSYVKRRAHGTNPKTTSQMNTRVIVSHLSNVYSFTLTDADRAGWRALAAVTPTINRLGNTTFLSGQQLFVKLNVNVYHFGSSYNTTAPASLAVSTPTALTIDAVHGVGGHLILNTTVPGAAVGEVVMYMVSPPMNPGRNFISSQLRRLASYYTVNVNDTVTTPYTNIFGNLPPAAGQRIFVRVYVVNTNTGATSAPFQASDLWT